MKINFLKPLLSKVKTLVGKGKVAEEVKEVAEKTAPKSVKEVRAKVLEQYTKAELPAISSNAQDPFVSEKMLKDITNPNNVGAKVICYPARTVVDMQKKDGTFVRRVYDPTGQFMTKEKIIKKSPELTTKDVVYRKNGTGYSVRRDAAGDITERKDWMHKTQYRMDIQRTQYPVGSTDISHKKIYEKGKLKSGEVKKLVVNENGLGELSIDPEDSAIARTYRSETITKYDTKAKRQSTQIHQDSKGYTHDHAYGKRYHTEPKIEPLTQETLDVLK